MLCTEPATITLSLKAGVFAQRLAAVQAAAAKRPEPTAPNAEAASAITQAEQTEDAQGLSEYSPDQVPRDGVAEGTGQEAEASAADYATPTGVRNSDSWVNSADSDQDQAGGKQPQAAAEPPQEAAKPAPAKKTPKPRKTAKPKPQEELVAGDPGGGAESGAGAADTATPTGVQRPGAKAKAGRPKRPKAAADKPAPKPRGRPKLAKTAQEDPWEA